jgi:hypothetical protein
MHSAKIVPSEIQGTSSLFKSSSFCPPEFLHGRLGSRGVTAAPHLLQQQNRRRGGASPPFSEPRAAFTCLIASSKQPGGWGGVHHPK